MHRSSGPLPIHDAVQRALQHAEDDLSQLLHHEHHQRAMPHIEQAYAQRPYHDPEPDSTSPEAPMSNIAGTLEADFEKVKTKFDEAKAEVEGFAATKLPAVLDTAKKLDGNPVVDALLAAVHVPAEALDMAVKVINGLEELYKPETGAAAPTETPAAAPVTA